MSFFGLCVQPLKAYKIEIPKGKRLHLTAACVSPEKPTPTALTLTVDQKTHIIASIGSAGHLMASLDLAFGHGQTISFSVTGAMDMHLTGYFEMDADMYFNEEMTQREFEESFDETDDDEDMEGAVEALKAELEAKQAMKSLMDSSSGGKKKRKRDEAEDAPEAAIEGMGGEENGEPKKKKKKKKKAAKQDKPAK
eukprot:TRINITY_DN952_c0_g1_i1.p2 TRINITY_DN952_c0_g1~~TRINITY_DN952_c0_g1_i1.p2  ORF type:complete len:195 (+),score=102.59 TRINITY_DN952_c0_g1_i1:121-705(+)